jgi:hypothetical protein
MHAKRTSADFQKKFIQMLMDKVKENDVLHLDVSELQMLENVLSLYAYRCRGKGWGKSSVELMKMSLEVCVTRVKFQEDWKQQLKKSGGM